MTIHDLRQPVASQAELALRDPRDAEVFQLGQPHLSSRGLDHAWFLRTAEHRHRWAIAGPEGCGPASICDARGRRAIMVTQACVLTCKPGAFAEDDTVELQDLVRPGPRNGWRSRTDLVSASGARATVELVTAFVTRSNGSNRSLQTAEMPDRMTADADTDAALRTDTLRRMGAKTRSGATTIYAAPTLTVRLDLADFFDALNLVASSTYYELFSRSEALTGPEEIGAARLVDRRMHVFGNLDHSDVLDFVSTSRLRAPDPARTIAVSSHARRRADGEVVAVAESIYRD